MGGVVGWGGGMGWVAHEILVSAQGPLVLGLGLRGLGPGLDNNNYNSASSSLSYLMKLRLRRIDDLYLR